MLLAAASLGSAEGTGGRERITGTARRIHGASFLKPVAGGLATVGGARLRWLPPGATAWKTLFTRQGNLSRLGLDDAGARILAVWEQDPTLHLFGLRDGTHLELPLPPLESAHAQFLYVHSLAFDPDGRHALIYMNGPAQGGGRRMVTQAYRIALDANHETRQLWEIHDSSELVWTGPRGALHVTPKDPGGKGNWQANLSGQLTAFSLENDEVRRTVIHDGLETRFRSVKVASGSTPDRMLLTLTTGRGGHGLLTYRWGDDRAGYHALPPGPGPAAGPVLAMSAPLMLYVIDRGRSLEVVRAELPPSQRSTRVNLRSPTIRNRVRGGERTLASRIHTLGIRKNGGAWLQVGDDLALIGADGRVRRVDLAAYFGRKHEWTGALYLEDPETLWIAVEIGAGRDWIRAPLDDLERRATPWPAVLDDLPPVNSEDYEDRDRRTKCLPPGTIIETPAGPVAVSDLRPGDPVWSADGQGRRIEAAVLRTGRSIAPAGHRMVTLRLVDGRTLTGSPNHPLGDGREFGTLVAGARLASTGVAEVRWTNYTGETCDILPTGPTGCYWINGLLIGSTLQE